MNKDFIALSDFSRDELLGFIERTVALKEMRKKGQVHQPLKGKTLGMIFNKPSTRTRISFEVGMFDLGGHSLFLTRDQMQIHRGESLKDSARVLSRYLDAILIRTFDHDDVVELARQTTIPVINGLTDLNHPVQVLADLFTLYEKLGRVEDFKVAYVGDGNNVSYSWLAAAGRLNFHLAVASPPGCRTPVPPGLKQAPNIDIIEDPFEAVKNADVIYTDVWVSMGQEGQESEKLNALKDYQINSKLVAASKKDVRVMHCLPAHRDEEITAEVLDGPHSIVWDQAENRLHAQKTILETLLTRSAT